MAYSAAMLGWALYEYGDDIEASGRDFILKGTLPLPLTILLPATEVTVSFIR